MTALFAFDMSAFHHSLNEISETIAYSPYYYANRIRAISYARDEKIAIATSGEIAYDKDGDIEMEIVKPRVVIPLYDEDGEALFDTSIPMQGKPTTNPARYRRTPYPPAPPVIDRSQTIPVHSTYAPIYSVLPLDDFNETVFDILNDFCQTHGGDLSKGGIQYHYTTIHMSFHHEMEFTHGLDGTPHHANEISKHTIQFYVNYDAAKMYHTAVDGLVFEEIAELYNMLHIATCLNAPSVMMVENSNVVCVTPEPDQEDRPRVVYRYY